VHTNSAASTVDRFVNAFAAEQQHQIRGLLADSLAGIVAQQLLPRADGAGRVAAHEILFGNIALASLIRESKTQQIASFIQQNVSEGMQAMDVALERLVTSGVVTGQDALDKALDKDAFARIPAVARQLSPELRAEL
jgi:twitching motility protein PilT